MSRLDVYLDKLYIYIAFHNPACKQIKLYSIYQQFFPGHDTYINVGRIDVVTLTITIPTEWLQYDSIMVI